MHKIREEVFKRFFFDGIEDKEEVKDGILYFSSKKVYASHVKENWYTIPNEQFESEILDEASKKYRQFYRFVILNDTSNTDTSYVKIQDLRKELQERIQLLRQRQEIIDTKAGVFFVRRREKELMGGANYVLGKGIQGEEGWTKQIYDILERLEELEKEDKKQYQEYWLLAKRARDVNRVNKEERRVCKDGEKEDFNR